MGATNPPFMSGVPELLCLQVLSRGESYGYDIVRQISLLTGETIRLGEGVVYPVLHALERSGALRARRKAVGGRTRVYYHITAKGRRRADTLKNRWADVRTAVDQALGEQHVSLRNGS